MNKTLFLSQSSDEDPTDQPQPEARMREALGLRSDGTRVAPSAGLRVDRPPEHGAGNPRRHRFVQEGEIPVEVMPLGTRGPAHPGSVSRHRVDDGALAAEKLAREQAERAFTEAGDRLRELQTKLGHAELARDEALALAAGRQAQIDALQAQLLAPAPTPPPRLAAVPKAASVKRGRGKAPKPVKWWIKSVPQPE